MKTIAALNEDGWVSDSYKILDYLVSYYILSDDAQSLLFQDNIINLPKTYFMYINDPDGMKIGIKQDLDKLLSRYFSVVDVETEVKKLSESNYGILLSVAVINNDGVKVEINKVTEIDTSKSRSVINLNNYGDGIDFLNNL